MASILDLVYVLAVLLVSIGGLVGLWLLTRDDHQESGVKWQGLLVVAAAGVFIAVMIGQFILHLWRAGI